MKKQYPRINNRAMSKQEQRRFDTVKNLILESIKFDKQESELEIANKDIAMLAWNAAYNLLYEEAQELQRSTKSLRADYEPQGGER